MKAVVINEFGSPDTLTLAQTDQPSFSDDQVLIRVSAAGINPVDAKIRSGKHISSDTLKLPAILGKDMSGIVEAVGKNVTDFKAGDEVFGCINNSYAEYTVCSPYLIVKKPENISFEEAAAVSLAGLTAYQAIHDHLKLLSGQSILIQSAAGGVGHLAVQFAKLSGAFVYGTASGKNAAFLREIGVDQPIDYRTEKFEDMVQDLDAVLETMGGEALYRSIACVKPGGTVVCLPSSTMNDPKALELAAKKNVQLIWFMMQPKKETLQLIADLMGEKKLKVSVDQILPIEKIAQAHKAIEALGVRGKMVVRL
ncbi:NADP-dependent oxidoreductase [Pedobacter psychroterrae]|uniref:NADP-dependent oxidoreductase n=1 Tax=Pedobacter psychroterrae TaxID=2530453 RepID=A0A4R0ND60_9SPHI|nr:NADP-dependent oxidoreductase [Pedobacter psychroterrae]TCC98299.1 NADP-dependent oxidoreductase [Pedobacter psychroterrae]